MTAKRRKPSAGGDKIDFDVPGRSARNAPPHPEPSIDAALIGERERAALAAVCATFVPEASDLGVADRLVAELAAIGRPKLVADLRLFLHLIESRLANLALVGRPVRFTRLEASDRERYLLRWADSKIPVLRSGFQAAKRLSLYLAYSASDADSLRAATGYTRPDPLPLPERPITIASRAVSDGEVLECDVCVVGSGAGGAVAAAEATAAGRTVIVLERGPAWTESELEPREDRGTARFFWDRGLAATEDLGITVFAGRALGGGTVVNWSTSLRLPEEVREEWTALGVDGLGSELDEHYEAIERRLDIDTDESPRNAQNAALARGLDALGLPWRVIPRNVRGCLGDPARSSATHAGAPAPGRDERGFEPGCGHCGYGCRLGAKQSTARTYLSDAVARGTTVIAECEARRVVVARGAAVEVEAQAGDRRIRVRAERIFLAGGAIGTPALLLRSGLGGPEAGRGLRLHPVPAVVAVHDEPIRMWSGVPQSVVSDAFARLEGGYGFRLEVPPVLPGVAAAALAWRSAADHRARMRELERAAAIIPIVRDREAGRVAIDGSGRALLFYRVRGQTARLAERAIVEAARIHIAAGAREVRTLHTDPLVLARGGDVGSFARAVARRGVGPNRVGMFSAHQMSTARMGSDPRASVADPDGRVRGLRGLVVADASAFPNASGVNPMLTVMALARRNARRMLAGM